MIPSRPAECARPALAYESAGSKPVHEARRRPVWVYGVVGAYAVLIIAFGGWALGSTRLLDDDIFSTSRMVAGVLLGAGASLLLIPVRVATRRPVARSSLWLPLVGSGALAGALAGGAGLALAEYWRVADSPRAATAVLGAVGLVWAGWCVVFWTVSLDRTAEQIGARLHRYLLAGSVLELLIAVPTHVVVRRREECCAGIATGLGICAGVAVMLIAFGPSVAFLYYRRWKQVRPRRRQAPPPGIIPGVS